MARYSLFRCSLNAPCIIDRMPHVRTPRSGKQVFGSYNRLESACMGITLQPVGRDERRVQGVSRACEYLEIVDLVAHGPLVCACGSVVVGGEFHLAYVDDPVLPVYEEVDLAPVHAEFRIALARPCPDTAPHAGDAERQLDLRHVLEADPLEREAAPCVSDGRVLKVAPEPLAAADLCEELLVEEREIVDYLVERPLGLLAEGGVPANETAAL